MKKILCVLVAGIVVAATGCSNGSRTVDVRPGAVNGPWLNEAGWVCDGESCRVPKAIQSRRNG